MKNKKLQECLNYIQVSLNAPKNLHNAFGKYNYRNLEGIFEGLKPLLKETGCVITITDSLMMVGDRYYIKATASIWKGEESHVCEGWARETEVKKGMDESQITGSTSSYARKYAMNGLFAIDDTQDADSMDNRNTVQSKPKSQKTPPKKAFDPKLMPRPSSDSKMPRITQNSDTIEFGTHQGEKWSEVEEGWLVFMSKKDDATKNVMDCRNELLRRKESPVVTSAKKQTLQEMADNVVNKNIEKLDQYEEKEDEIVGAIKDLDKRFGEEMKAIDEEMN